MKNVGRKLFVLGLLASLGLVFLMVPQMAAAEWAPKKPVEFIIMAGKGGGADRLSRFIQGIIEGVLRLGVCRCIETLEFNSDGEIIAVSFALVV